MIKSSSVINRCIKWIKVLSQNIDIIEVANKKLAHLHIVGSFGFVHVHGEWCAA